MPESIRPIRERLPDDVRKEIEPHVREAHARLCAVRDAVGRGDSAEEIQALFHRAEYALGYMLPTIQGRLDVTLFPSLLGATIHATG